MCKKEWRQENVRSHLASPQQNPNYEILLVVAAISAVEVSLLILFVVRVEDGSKLHSGN